MTPRLLAVMFVAEHERIKKLLEEQKQQTHTLKILFQEQETCVLSYHRAALYVFVPVYTI